MNPKTTARSVKRAFIMVRSAIRLLLEYEVKRREA